jgi:glycine hydroxymethyltransferase
MILGGDYIDAQDIVELITKQHNFRNNSINLIASENIMLPESEKYYGNEFMHRYAEGKPYKRYYNGTKYYRYIRR